MNYKILEDILKIVKMLKCDYVLINGNNIYGTNEGFNIFRYMEFDNKDNIKMCFVVNSMVKFLKNIGMNEIQIKGPLLYSSFDNTIDIFNPILESDISNMHFRLYDKFNESYHKVIDVPILEDINFQKTLELKSADGAMSYKYDKYIMYIYNNLIPCNKGDKILLNIYDDLSCSFLATFITVKKKYKIHTSVMYLHIG